MKHKKRFTELTTWVCLFPYLPVPWDNTFLVDGTTDASDCTLEAKNSSRGEREEITEIVGDSRRRSLWTRGMKEMREDTTFHPDERQLRPR